MPTRAKNGGIPLSPPDLSRRDKGLFPLEPGASFCGIVFSNRLNTGGRYCAEPPSVAAHLNNISTRASVQTGQGVTIAGFIVTGTESKQVVIRGLGPTLTQHGVAGALAEPFLSLFDGNGNVLWTNNDWKDSQQAAIQATGLAPTNDLESAILRTLAPGNYTAICLAGIAPPVLVWWRCTISAPPPLRS